MHRIVLPIHRYVHGSSASEVAGLEPPTQLIAAYMSMLDVGDTLEIKAEDWCRKQLRDAGVEVPDRAS